MPKQKPEDLREKFHRLTASEAETQAEAASDQEARQATTRPRTIRQPAVDPDGMPLPNRVDEIDMSATRVSRAAFEHTPGPTTRPPALTRRGRGAAARRRTGWRRTGGCLLRAFIASLFLGVAGGMLVVAFGVYQYYSIASSLPSVSDLRARAAQFETTRILDREGGLLYEILDPNAGRRTYVPLDEISPYLVAATVSAEDKDYYTHRGFDPLAILRAFWQNLSSGETVSGASTITQQLARSLLLSPEERNQQTYMRKVREAILAIEIERRYTKDEILELFLNESYYGNLAYGIEAAAETYFGKTAGTLDLSESAFLAGLPQAPSYYDIFSNAPATLNRHQTVVMLMFQLSEERGCIHVSNNPQPVCVDAVAAAGAIRQMEQRSFVRPSGEMRYPHWVQYIRTLLEARYDPQTIYRSGFTVTTTLDPDMQDAAQQSVTAQVAALVDRHVTGGALVAIQPSTGEILAMVGSPDFFNDAASGQINMAVSPTRQPGSSIKPFTYLAAFEKGWTPATLIWDVPSQFPPSGRANDPNPPYIPTNYSHSFRGPVTLRSALANSLNIPAVKTLYFVGVYDDPATPQKDGLVGMAERLGMTSLTREDYGLSLTLGGGEVSLLEMTAGYAVIANGGVRVPPVAILKIVDFQGNVVFEAQPPRGEQVLRPEHAFLMSSILSDNAARAPVFGTNSLLNLPFPVAVKTGTSNDARDNWTIGYTPDLAVGVWVGNPDYTPMVNTTGITGAGPIWSEFMTFAVYRLTGGNPTPFYRPEGIVQRTICSVSGTEPSRWCPSQREEYFAFDQLPLPNEYDLWTEAVIDGWTLLLASPECSQFTVRDMVINVREEWARNWILQEQEGRDWARDMGFNEFFFIPERQCTGSDPSAQLQFFGLQEGQTITSALVDIDILATATRGFLYWRLDWGVGTDPTSWTRLINDSTVPVTSPSRVLSWDVSAIGAQQVTLRLYMDGEQGHVERRLHLTLLPPTAIPTETATPTPTETPTASPQPSDTPTETPTPSLTLLPSDTETPLPSETP
jgi:penicillin-binding protein 1C